MQDIVNVCHNDDNFVNNFKRHNFRIRKIEIMFSNKFNLIKIRKILQILRTLRINVQLTSLNQFDKNIFKLMIVSSHLIVDTNFAFVFFQKETRVYHLFCIFIFIFFSHFFIKRISIAINI